MDENLVKLNNSIEKMMEEYPRRVVMGAINELIRCQKRNRRNYPIN